MASYQKMLMKGLLSATLLSGCSPPVDEQSDNDNSKINNMKGNKQSQETHHVNLKTKVINEDQKTFEIIRNISKSKPYKIKVINSKNEVITQKGNTSFDNNKFKWSIESLSNNQLQDDLGSNIKYKINYSNGKTYEFKQELKYEGVE